MILCVSIVVISHQVTLPSVPSS